MPLLQWWLLLLLGFRFQEGDEVLYFFLKIGWQGGYFFEKLGSRNFSLC